MKKWRVITEKMAKNDNVLWKIIVIYWRELKRTKAISRMISITYKAAEINVLFVKLSGCIRINIEELELFPEVDA